MWTREEEEEEEEEEARSSKKEFFTLRRKGEWGRSCGEMWVHIDRHIEEKSYMEELGLNKVLCMFINMFKEIRVYI